MRALTGEQKRHNYLTKPTKLMAVRLRKNASQIETARSLDMSRIHYGNIEKGLYTPREELAESIAKHFKTTMTTIFKKVDNVHYVAKK